MPQSKRAYHKKLQKISRKKRLNRKRRLKEQQREAQRHIRALEQGVEELGLPQKLEERLRRKVGVQGKLMRKIFAMMMPSVLGARSYQELCFVLGWDSNLPGRILRALPKRKWLELLRELGQEIVQSLAEHLQGKSEATLSRWKMTLVADDSVFKKYGSALGLVGSWWSGQEKRVRTGIDGLLLLVVVGDGKLMVPLDFEIRRPDPQGAGHPSRDKVEWLEVMVQRSVEGLRARAVQLPHPILAADGWFGIAHLMQHLSQESGTSLLVEGKSSFVFDLPDGRRLRGSELLAPDAGLLWRKSSQFGGVRYARLHASSPSFGEVTLTVVDDPNPKRGRSYLLCLRTCVSSPRLIHAYRLRNWVEWCFRTLKNLLCTEACQTPNEDAYYGHLVLRLIGFTLLSYTARRLLKGTVTMEQMVRGIKHYWRSLDSNLLEFEALSCEHNERAA